MIRLLSVRNLLRDRFGTFAAILGVALGTATVEVVLVLDANTVAVEESSWSTNPEMTARPDTISLRGLEPDGTPTRARGEREETHEDYEVMRSAIRLGSLSAFLVGALIVFFTFAMVVERKKREAALLRSLGGTRAQVAAIFVAQAAIVGAIGAALGFVLALPMSVAAAIAGITTTGRAYIYARFMWFPYRRMLVVSVIGAVTALLGVIRPARDLLRLDVSKTLRPRFLEDDPVRAARRRTRGITLIALPFSTLLYVLMRPFFKSALPSLTFFVLEAALVVVAFLMTLWLVPDVVRRAGTVVGRLVSLGPASAGKLLVQRRIERMGDELSASVSGVMLVFSLLLALHIATHALTHEVGVWSAGAIEPYGFVFPGNERVRADRATLDLPPGVVKLRFSSRTPWPCAVHAVEGDELVRFADATGRADLASIARAFGPGKVILSKLLARRYRIGPGDLLEVTSPGKSARLTVAGVTDDLGWVPSLMPYRNSKTYAVLESADFPLIAAFAKPIGYAIALAPPRAGESIDWDSALARVDVSRGLVAMSGRDFERKRIAGTERDFEIFDVILVLTTFLAAVGVANHLALAVHARRRELALYRVLGMTAGDVRKMILAEGGFVGVLGGALAVILGIPLGFAAIGALRAVSAFTVEFDLPWRYPVLVLLGATAVSVLASLHPARRAASASSAQSIHYE